MDSDDWAKRLLEEDQGTAGDVEGLRAGPIGSVPASDAPRLQDMPAAMPDGARWLRIDVGMFGPLWVHALNGEPKVPAARRPDAYRDIARLDLAEYWAWRSQLPTTQVETCMSDFGVLYTDGSFEPPHPDSRQATLEGALCALDTA